MKIALIQQPASPDRQTNLNRGTAQFEVAARAGADLICYAELAFDPFYPQNQPSSPVLELAETIPGPTTSLFCELASRYGVATILNIFERDGDKTYDSSPVIDGQGRILGKTRMVHVPDYPCFHEQAYYTPGDLGAPVYDLGMARVGIAICYDRHYPEYMRALGVAGADLVVTPQAGAVGEWPDGLFEAEMRVASFQNGYFTALCNRVGREPKIEFAGESFVCNPGGEVIARAGRGTDEILYADLAVASVASSHARKQFFADRRDELYTNWL